jgi:hypothetical protein
MFTKRHAIAVVVAVLIAFCCVCVQDELPSWGDDDIIDDGDEPEPTTKRERRSAAPKEKKEKRLVAVRGKIDASEFE